MTLKSSFLPLALNVSRRECTLAGAIAACFGSDVAVCLMTGPERFVVGRLERGALRLPRADSVATDQFYEARVFNEFGELRWVRRSESGFAAYLSEAAPPVGAKDWDAGTIEAYGFDDQQVIWGDVASVDDGWMKMASRRIGDFIELPYSGAGAGDILALNIRNYFRADERLDGNLSFVGSRLIKFEKLNKPKGRANA